MSRFLARHVLKNIAVPFNALLCGPKCSKELIGAFTRSRALEREFGGGFAPPALGPDPRGRP
eukprot:1935268-Heterocapsa_arctica.AAC.1